MVTDLQAIDPSLLTPIRNVVYDSLRQAILDGSIAPGERLVESELAETLNVSRMPVREAIRKLETEGLVEHQPRRGAVVKTFSEEDILEIYTLREAMEALAAVQAVRRATQEEILNLEKAMNEIDRLCDLGNEADAREVFEANRIFSEGVIAACHMPRLIQVINTYKDYLERFRRVTLAGPSRRELVRREHRGILEAIRDRDEKRAEALTREHIRGALEAYLRSFSGHRSRQAHPGR
ncbi:MAG: GntR family transcriptional regulator [Synergistales bacterium]